MSDLKKLIKFIQIYLFFVPVYRRWWPSMTSWRFVNAYRLPPFPDGRPLFPQRTIYLTVSEFRKHEMCLVRRFFRLSLTTWTCHDAYSRVLSNRIYVNKLLHLYVHNRLSILKYIHQIFVTFISIECSETGGDLKHHLRTNRTNIVQILSCWRNVYFF